MSTRITNRDLFALTLRYAMESDLAIERYAKYKGEKTPSLFSDDDKPSWVKQSEWDESKHPRVEKGSKGAHGGQFTSAKQQGFAGMTLAEAFGPVGKKHVEDHKKPDGIESKEKLPLFDKAEKEPAKVQDESKATDSHEKLLAESAPYSEQGPNYNRNIHTKRERLKTAIERSQSDEMREMLANDLKGAIKLESPNGPSHELKDGVFVAKPGREIPWEETHNGRLQAEKDKAKALQGGPKSIPDSKRELSDQEQSEREFADNFNAVSEDPEAATSRNLHRAYSFLSGEMNSARRKHSRGEITIEQLRDRIDGFEREQVWYKSILQKRGDYAGGGPYSDEKPVKPQEKAKRPSGLDSAIDQAKKELKSRGKTKPSDSELQAATDSILRDRSANNAVISDFADSRREQKEYDDRQSRVKDFLSEHPGAASNSMLKGDAYQVIDDVKKGRLTPGKALAAARKAVELKLMQPEKLKKLEDEFSEKQESGIVMPSKTVPNEEAKPGDQLGLFGDAVKAKVPTFKPKLLDQPKQGGLFDTKGNPDQMDLFGDGAMPDDMVYKPESKAATPPADGIPRVSNDEWVDGGWDTAHAGLASENVISKMAQGMKGIEGQEYGMREHSPGKWQMISKPGEKANKDVDADSIAKMAPGANKRMESEKQGREDKTTELEANRKWAENHITIAADDISKLRKQDVYRVLDNAPNDKRGYLESWIQKQRPDLSQQVNEDSQEIDEERANANASGKPWTVAGLKSVVDAHGGHENNSADNVEAIRRKMYEKHGAAAPSTKAIREHMDAMRQETDISKAPAFKPTLLDQKKSDEVAKPVSRTRTDLDFGEKIEVRKHRATATGPRAKKELTDAEKERAAMPAWRKRYDVAEDANNPGEHFIVDRITKQPHGDSDPIRSGSFAQELAKRLGKQGKKPSNFVNFKNKEAAEKQIAQIEVNRNHGVKGRDGDYQIYRKVSDSKHPVVKGGFASREDAELHMKNNAAEIIEHEFPRYETYQYLDKVERTGGKDHRNGKDAKPEDFQKVFNSRAGVFGNWQSNKDGQVSLNHAYDGLHDLAEALNLPPKAISLNGQLAIGFGADGTGGKDSARAHYAPDKGLINLTKMKGAGSLAHEWFHALDHHLSKMAGNSNHTTAGMYKTGDMRKELADAIKGVHNAIAAKSVTEAITAAEGPHMKKIRERDEAEMATAKEKNTRIPGARTVDGQLWNIRKDMESQAAYKKKTISPELMKQFNELSEKLSKGDTGKHGYAQGFPSYDNLHELNKVYKQATGRSFHTKQDSSPGMDLYHSLSRHVNHKQRVIDAAEGKTETRNASTDYLKEARRLDETFGGDYYSKKEEMGARAFEAYIQDKLAGKGIKSQYLGAKANNSDYPGSLRPFPHAGEREAINAAFDHLFATLKHQGRTDDKGEHVQLYSSRFVPMLLERYANDHWKDQVRNNLGRWTSEGLPEVDETELDSSSRKIRDRLYDWANANLRNHSFKNEETGWDVLIDKTGIKKTLSQNEDSAKTILAAPDLIRNAVLHESKPNADPKSDETFHYFVCPVILNGDTWAVKLSVRSSNQIGKRLYSLHAIEIEKGLPSKPGDSKSKFRTSDKPSPVNIDHAWAKIKSGNDYYSQFPDERYSKPFIDDGDLFYDARREQADRERYDAITEALSVERYDTTWDESKHHRAGKGTQTGGQFTSNGGGAPVSSGNRPGGSLSPRMLEGSQMRVQSNDGGAWGEVKKPATPKPAPTQPASPEPQRGFSAKTREIADHPELQSHHSLNIKNQERTTAMRLNDMRAGYRNLLANAARKATFQQDDPHYQPDEETVWANVDKNALQSLLARTNQADHESIRAGGPKFHELANANQIIPKIIAERLHGGSRFFDPEKLRGRWNEPSPQTAPEQEKKQDTLLTPQEMGQPNETAPKEVPQAEAQSQPEESAQPVPQPQKLKRAPITPESLQSVFGEKLPAGVSKAMNTKLEKQIRNALGDDPEIVKAFKPIVFQAWKQLSEEANEHNAAIRQVTNTAASLYDSTRKDENSVSAPPQKLTALVKMARSGQLDPSQKKGFDLMVDNAQRNFPQYLAGRGEDGFVDWLTDGIKPQPNLLDAEVGERAVTLAGGEFFRQFDQGEAPEQDEAPDGDWKDQFSWSVARVMVERYRNPPTRFHREPEDSRIKHVKVHGILVSIETAKGEKRNPGSPSLAADYGYIRQSLSRDHVDTFVGPRKESDIVYLIDGKVMLQFSNQADAISAYQKSCGHGKKVGPVTAMTIAQFKNWIASGKHKRPIAKQVSRYGFKQMLLERYSKPTYPSAAPATPSQSPGACNYPES